MKTLRFQAGLTLITAAAMASAQYTVTPICLAGGFASPGSFQINQNGKVSGQKANPDGIASAFLWDPSSPHGTTGTLINLTGGKGTRTEVHGLNNRGDVVGTIYKPHGSGPLATFNNIAAYWPYGGAAVSLDSTVFQTNGEAINDSGEIAFFYNDNKTYSGGAVSRVVNGKRKTYLLGASNSWPTAMNASAQVLAHYGGIVWSPNPSHTAWTAFSTGLGAASDINDSGAAAGGVDVGPGYCRPAVYLPVAMYGLQAGVTNLFDEVTAALPFYPWPYQSNCGAGAINGNGVIVGAIDSNSPDHVYATWIRDPLLGVSQITLPGWSHIAPNDINDYGQIVATAISDVDGLIYCILLTP